MYRPESEQISVFENESFFQFQGLNPDNDWVRLAKLIPWAELERRYAQTFTSKLGNVGKPARMALGALIIKERYGFSDEDTVQEIRMNPYLQFFIGLPAFQHEAPFDASTMTLFRKRIPIDMLTDLNDFIAGRRTLMPRIRVQMTILLSATLRQISRLENRMKVQTCKNQTRRNSLLTEGH